MIPIVEPLLIFSAQFGSFSAGAYGPVRHHELVFSLSTLEDVEAFGNLQVPAITAGLRRRHSARATADTTMQTRRSPPTITHSNDPL